MAGYAMTAETIAKAAGGCKVGGGPLRRVLERYASLNPDIVAVVGPDRFPPAIFAAAST